MSVTEVHEEKNTFQVDVNIPGHDPRVSTPLFRASREMLIQRESGRCWVSGMTAEEAGQPLEAHHHPIERSFAEMIDWTRFSRDCLAGLWGPHAQGFDWAHFDPKNPYTFVDDMTVNGVLLAKKFHTGKDEGTHCLPYPVWVAQKYGLEGYAFSSIEIIHHDDQVIA